MGLFVHKGVLFYLWDKNNGGHGNKDKIIVGPGFCTQSQAAG